jgi:sigma-B regulation protein RsbU (phosphoserine phosphatase)
LDSNDVLFAVGDVSGKGAAAALYGAMVSGLLRTLAPPIQRPGAVLKALNDALTPRRIYARYVTMMLAQWCPETKTLRMANSGGVPPLILKKDGLLEVPVEGVPLGLLANREYDEVEVLLESGDVVVLVSDGIPDQTNANDEDFGRDRIVERLRATQGQSADAVANDILNAVGAFAGGTPVFDDQTLIVLRVA